MIGPKPLFALTQEERSSHLWRKLESHFTDRLATCRALNDQSSLAEIQTARLRGEIKNLKDLLALSTRDPTMEADEE